MLDNPSYQEAVQKITQDIRTLRLALGPRDTEGAHKLVLMEQAIEKAKWLMEGYLANADHARKELENEVHPGPIGRLTGRVQRLVR